MFKHHAKRNARIRPRLRNLTRNVLTLTVVMMLLIAPTPLFGQGVIADHTSVASFDFVPLSTISQVETDFRIFYGHTSHGSQILTGLSLIEFENSSYSEPQFYEIEDDLGVAGDISWVQPTRDFLDNNPGYNIVMWSWCGGVSDNTEDGINTYLSVMSQLEQEYPAVTFVYMTGHLDGTGASGNLYERNNQIRTYCQQNNKVLFDFADIESYDPDEIAYPNGTDACEWCESWCVDNECPSCTYCAHSHCLNCYRKGKAFWWMMARLTGWNLVTDVDFPTEPSLPIVFQLRQNHPNPFNPSTTIEYTISRRSRVTIDVYNILGERVATLLDRDMPAGTHQQVWDASDEQGSDLSSGIYIYRMSAGEFQETRKMLLLR